MCPSQMVTQGRAHRLMEWGQRLENAARPGVPPKPGPGNRRPGSTSRNEEAKAGPRASMETEQGQWTSSPSLV